MSPGERKLIEEFTKTYTDTPEDAAREAEKIHRKFHEAMIEHDPSLKGKRRR